MQQLCKTLLDSGVRDQLHSINHVKGVGIAFKQVNGTIADPKMICVRVTVDEKIDESLLKQNEIIPKYYNFNDCLILTDVVELKGTW